MAEFLERQERNVIPQWRPFQQTVEAGIREITSVAPADRHRVPELPREPLIEAAGDFARNRSVWYATDLLSAASSIGDHAAAAEAAEFILTDEKTTPAARRLAEDYLGISPTTTPLAFHERAEMSRARRTLNVFPNDAIAWADLCYGLAVAGKREAANRAMAAALHFAPLNRFVLRAAARFYAHTHDAERALALLRASPRTPLDPWLVAAEIGTARLINVAPKFIRQGRDLLTGKFAPCHITELASALGTMEYYGDNRSAKNTAYKLLDKSLEDPNDNSLAQATWFKVVKKARTKDLRLARRGRSYEAHATDAMHRGDVPALLDYASSWFDDQPFAAKPAEIYAWAAVGLSIDQTVPAIDILRRATTANPNTAQLWNNLAFAHMLQGDLDSARQALKRGFASTDRMPFSDVCLTATNGMLLFRQDHSDRGREAYLASVDTAIEQKFDDRVVLSAYTNLAREEAIAGTPVAEEAMLRALAFAKRATYRPENRALVNVMLQQIATIRPGRGVSETSLALANLAQDVLLHTPLENRPQHSLQVT